MRVATWNIHRGRGAGGRFRPGRVTEVLAEIGADLVALQEAQHWLRPVRGMLDADAIERDCGLVPLPVTGRAGEQGWRSNVVLVPRRARLLRPAVGLRLGGWEPRGAILAELDLGAGAVRVVAAHLSLGAATRRAQGAAILAALDEGPPLPALVMGDFNEWRAGGSALGVLAARFGPAPRAPTFPSFRPTLSLDVILGWPRGLVSGLTVHDTPAARRASDHLPLVARVEAGVPAGA